jgi:type II secretory pathway pseudopilin PulG
MGLGELLGEKVVPSVLSGLGGAAAWGWRTFSGLQKRLQAVEQDLKTLRQALKDLEEKEDRRTRSTQVERRVQAKVADRVLVLEQRMSAAETDITANNATLHRHAQEQVEQWTDFTRTLGYLEGKLQGEPPSKGRKT